MVYGDRVGDLDLNSLAVNDGFKIIGENDEDESGYSVSVAGDINGDGIDDLIIGAPYVDAVGAESTDNSGASYVVYGTDGGRTGNLNLGSLVTDDGFKISGESENDRSGYSVSGAGDVNGDGYDDVITGAYNSSTNTGVSYVVYGGRTGNLGLGDLVTDDGFKITGSEGTLSGLSVSGAGDINDDGYDDLIIGSRASQGLEAYVLYGGASNYLWAESEDVNVDFDGITKTMDTNEDGALSLVGSHGNDTLTWNGAGAVLIGGAGDDTLIISGNDFKRIDGGNGTDTLRFGAGLGLDFTGNEWRKNGITSIEVIDMVADPASNTLTLSAIDVLNISDTSNTLKVKAGANDILVLAGDGWPSELGDATIYTNDINNLAMIEFVGGESPGVTFTP